MKILKPNCNRHKGGELWSKSINDFVNLRRHFPCATSTKILAACTRVCRRAMAQFVLKIEKLSHIMGPTPILEMARAYGLRPRLWLLNQSDTSINIFRLTCVKLSTELENFKGVVSDDLSFAFVEMTKIIGWLNPGGEICVTGCHMTSRNQGLSSNDQGRQRRETLGTRLHW